MTDEIPDDQPDDGGATVLTPATAPSDAIAALGFDPALVQAVVLTPGAVVAVAVDYPDPRPTPPADDGDTTDAPSDPEEGDTDATD